MSLPPGPLGEKVRCSHRRHTFYTFFFFSRHPVTLRFVLLHCTCTLCVCFLLVCFCFLSSFRKVGLFVSRKCRVLCQCSQERQGSEVVSEGAQARQGCISMDLWSGVPSFVCVGARGGKGSSHMRPKDNDADELLWPPMHPKWSLLVFPASRLLAGSSVLSASNTSSLSFSSLPVPATTKRARSVDSVGTHPKSCRSREMKCIVVGVRIFLRVRTSDYPKP